MIADAVALVAVAFLLGVVEAGAIIWLLRRSHEQHAAFLQEQLAAKDAVILDLVTRIQAPSPVAYATMTKAVLEAKSEAALPLDVKAQAIVDRQLSEAVEGELWRRHPAMAGLELGVEEGPDGEDVYVLWNPDNMEIKHRYNSGEFHMMLLDVPRH